MSVGGAKQRLLLVDDHAVVRTGLRAILERHYEICGEAADGQEAIDQAVALKPDVILMDISMPKVNGIEATRWIRKLELSSKIVLISMHDSQQVAVNAREAGADLFLTKSSPAETLLRGMMELLNVHSE